MTAKRKDEVTVSARVYIPRGETTKARLRAKVTGGPFDGLKVSTPHAWREEWTPGQVFRAVAVVVKQADGKASYLKAHTMASGQGVTYAA